jgi:hypothetical protein
VTALFAASEPRAVILSAAKDLRLREKFEVQQARLVRGKPRRGKKRREICQEKVT